MDLEQKSLRVGAAVIAAAVALRLLGGGALQPVVKLLQNPAVASFLIYLETGRILRSPSQPAENWASESPPPEISQSSAALPVFAEADLALVNIHNLTDYQPDTAALLEKPLNWDLTGEGPTVLILHTHTTESYRKTEAEDYQESSAYHSLDDNYNMVSIGDALAARLEAAGIGVVHDRQIHDYPSYNGSYQHARFAMEELLAQNPTIQLVLDIHRDAADVDGQQLATFASVDGEPASQLMLVLGTDAGGLNHPNWQENLSLALKLQVTLEKQNPAICRDLVLRSSRFNQDLSPGALLVEVGAAGDTRTQALQAVDALAEGIITLAAGSATVNSAD